MTWLERGDEDRIIRDRNPSRLPAVARVRCEAMLDEGP